MSNSLGRAPSAARKGRRRTAGALLAFLALLAPTSMMAPAAMAAPADYRIGFLVTYDSPTDPTVGTDTRATIGTLAPRDGSGGNRVLCVTSGYNDPTAVAGGEVRTDNPAVGYLLSKYINTADDVTAAALAEVVKGAMDDHPEDQKLAWEALRQQHPDAVAPIEARMAELQSEAATYAGGYSTSPALGLNGSTGTASNLGVRAGSTWLSGYDTTAKLTGPAVFTATGTDTWTGATSDAAQTLEFTLTGPGTVGVSQSVTGLPARTYTYYPANGAYRIQSMVSVGPDTESASSNATLSADYAPTLGSAVGFKVYAQGETGTDHVTVRGGQPGVTTTATATVYGPLAKAPTAPSATAPAGTPVFDKVSREVTLNASGNADVDLKASKPFTEAGVYVWVEETSATAAMRAAVSTFGRPSETTAQVKPTITSQISKTVSKVGVELSDSVTISGVVQHDGVRYVLRGQALGPVAPVNGSCTAVDYKGAPVAAEITRDVTENGTITALGAFTPKDTQCYTYGYTLSVYDGEQLRVTVDHAAGQATQTAVVLAPGLTSQAFQSTGTVGSDFWDEVYIAGTAGQPGTITGYVLWQPADTCENLNWDNAEKLADITPVQTNGDGTFKTDPIKVDKVGCSTFVQTWTSSANPDVSVTQAAGEPTESMLFKAFVATGDGVTGQFPIQMIAGGSLAALVLVGVGVAIVAAKRRV